MENRGDHLITVISYCAQVEAWLADKDAEALRFQKLLVEEEEAAQRRCAVHDLYVCGRLVCNTVSALLTFGVIFCFSLSNIN